MKVKKPVKKESKDKIIVDLKDSLQRLQADFENYKKRIEKDNAVHKIGVEAQFIHELLPLIDHFQLALKQTANSEEFVKGIEMIYSQLYEILESKGVRPIDAEGKEFDPYHHEVLLQEKSEKDNIVLEELQKGYMLHDKVLRLSKVKIGKKEENGKGKRRVDKKANE
tara:strand:- start:2742 stop:3242 length:501 start_codon:yes stop_codon:yes gene_type:complete